MSNNPFKKKLKPIKTVNVGGFQVDFFFQQESIANSYMEIRTESRNFAMKIDARNEVYGYLLAAAQQDRNEQIHGYCATMYVIATGMTHDQEFVNDLQASISAFMERQQAKAKEEADKVTPEQITGDEALMQEAIERGELRGDKKAEKRASEESKKLIKEVLEEDNDVK